MFGPDDWTYIITKWEIAIPNPPVEILLSSMFDMYDEILLVLKGPNGNAPKSPETYVGYLLTLLISGNSVIVDHSPFMQGDSIQTISHYTFYGRDVSVPEPGTLGLIGIGLKRLRKGIA